MTKEKQHLAIGIGSIVLLGLVFWKYKCQISARLKLGLCEEVSHKINFDAQEVTDETALN